MKTVNRRAFTAIMLLFLVICLFQQPVYALTPEAKSNLKDMWDEASDWYNMIMAVILPLFIVRLAGFGLQILLSLGLSKGEFQLDAMKKDIFFCILALTTLCLLPVLIEWAIELLQDNAWDPYSITILPIGGGFLC